MAQDFAKSVRDFKGHQCNFWLNPTSWNQFTSGIPLSWQKIKFNPKNKHHIPQIRGVYAFIVQANHNEFPPHGYLMYIGITGDRKSKETLRSRYAGYISEQKSIKRPKIHFLLTNWQNNVYFCYSTIKDKRYRLGSLETKLTDALLPPFNINDFSAEIRQKVRAMR